MDIKITIPDAQKDRIIVAFTSQYGYKPEILTNEDISIPNPETRPQFFKRILVGLVKSAVQTWEAEAAVIVAKQISLADSDKLTIS